MQAAMKEVRTYFMCFCVLHEAPGCRYVVHNSTESRCAASRGHCLSIGVGHAVLYLVLIYRAWCVVPVLLADLFAERLSFCLERIQRRGLAFSVC